ERPYASDDHPDRPACDLADQTPIDPQDRKRRHGGVHRQPGCDQRGGKPSSDRWPDITLTHLVSPTLLRRTAVKAFGLSILFPQPGSHKPSAGSFLSAPM